MRDLDTPVIEAKDLTVSYKIGRGKRKFAVQNLSFQVGRGEIVGFIGPNGAGKTSAIKALLGFIPVFPGSSFISGVHSSDPRSRRSLGYMPEISYYPRYLKLSEFLHTCAALSCVPARQRSEAVTSAARRVGMGDCLNARLSSFSKGMLQQAGCAQALVHGPEILILDEPMSGLDPIARMRMRQLLSDLCAEGKTILFSSHELSEIELVADRILLLSNGRLLYQGPISDVVDANSNLEQVFLKLLKEELPWAA